MKVIIGHAVCSEEGGKYGKPGDQTGKEVRLQDWYLRDKGWKGVFRWKDTKLAKKAADYVTSCCTSSKVGYSQADGSDGRESLDAKVSQVEYDIDELSEDVNCDCSSLIASAVRSVGGKVSRGMYTGIEESELMKSGLFDEYKDKEYTDKPDNLITGDILWGDGHTAMVVRVESGSDEVTQGTHTSSSSQSSSSTKSSSNLSSAEDREFTVACTKAQKLVKNAADKFEKELGLSGIAESTEVNSLLGLLSSKLKAKYGVVHEEACKPFYVNIRSRFTVYVDMVSDKVNLSNVNPGTYTIVATSSDGLRGKLKSGAGWIKLDTI